MINRTSLLFKIVLVVLLVWVIQVLFLNQVVKLGMNGSDDWGWLFHYETRKPVDGLLLIKDDIGNPYDLQQTYSIGILKKIFGLNLVAFKLTHLLFKSLAALAMGYLVFKLSNSKLFAYLVVFFFIIFPSTAGILAHIVLGFNYLTFVFMSFSILFYVQSAKQKKKILWASLFFFLALYAGTARAYLLLPLPLIVELIRLKMQFKPYLFIQRLVIFYFLPYLFFFNSPSTFGRFQPGRGLTVRINQLTSGNLFTLALPFQMLSSLFIDQEILKNILDIGKVLPFANSEFQRFFIVNFILLIFSAFLGFVVKGKLKMWSFVVTAILSQIILEVFFYFLYFSSSHITASDCVKCIPFKSYEGFVSWLAPFNPSIYQAFVGGYFFIIGIILAFEWYKNQRDNKILLITVIAWLWSILTMVLLYLTSDWWSMVYSSIDRYILICSAGIVVFSAGIFTLCFRVLGQIKNSVLRWGFVALLTGAILLTSVSYYNLLDRFYYGFNERGGSSFEQENAYRRFLDKIGKENLKGSLLLYIDNGKYISPKTPSLIFNHGSFFSNIPERIYFDENNNLIRGGCRAVTDDLEVLRAAYSVKNGETGFVVDTECVNQTVFTNTRKVFYPLNSFYAYKMKGKEFVDIKDEVLALLNKTQ